MGLTIAQARTHGRHLYQTRSDAVRFQGSGTISGYLEAIECSALDDSTYTDEKN